MEGWSPFAYIFQMSAAWVHLRLLGVLVACLTAGEGAASACPVCRAPVDAAIFQDGFSTMVLWVTLPVFVLGIIGLGLMGWARWS